MSGIFISYRRDTSAYAGRLHDHLVSRFGRDQVFRDLDVVEPGVDFIRAINEAVRSCDAVLVAIGHDWLHERDDRGRRRIDDPTDIVRLEVEAALASENVFVVPVLVEGAAMPPEAELPPSLRGLAMRNAVWLTHSGWDHDVERLIAALERVVGRQPRPKRAQQHRPTTKTSAPSRLSNVDPPVSSSSAPATPSGLVESASVPDSAGDEEPVVPGPAAAEAASGTDLSDGVRTVLGFALAIHRSRASGDQVLAIDLLLAAFVRAQLGAVGSVEALYRSLPEPPPRRDRLAAALADFQLEDVRRSAPMEGAPAAVAEVVAAARRCAEVTTGSASVRSRHLMAAAVISLGFTDNEVMAQLGCTQTSLIAALRGYVGRHWPDESPAGWDQFLLGVVSPPAQAAQRGTASRATPTVLRTPALADDAQRLTQLAASVAAGSDGLDAAAIVIGALGEGTGRPSLPVASEMLARLLARPGAAVADPEQLARALIAVTGQATVHMAGPPDLSAPSTASLSATATEIAQQTTGAGEVLARHLLAAAVSTLDPGSDLVRVLGPSVGICAALRHAIAQTSPGDSAEAWDTILFGPDERLGGGYTRDVGWPERGEKDLSEDSLGRKDEADMFAALITDDNLTPPLAIGLFGSWGSGKSFFMKLIHRAVAAKVSDGSYAQIRFNAWHYSDANLWASLADEIFEQLADHLRPPKEDPAAALRRELDLKSETRKGIEARQAQVTAAQVRLRGELRDAVVKREQARADSSAAYAAQLASAITSDPEARHDLEVIGETLGIEEPVDVYRALAGEARYLRDESSALSRGARGRIRWSLLAAAAALVLVAVLAAFVPTAVRAWAPAVAGTAAAGLTLAARIVGSAGKVTAAARRFYERASAIDERVRTTPTKEQADLAGQLRDAEAAEAAAATQLAEVDARIAALQTELSELSGERQLYRFLVARADSNDYKAQLGIISIIRKDLETLVELLQGLQRQESQPILADEPDPAAAQPAPRALKRIVLYIDDLDRCDPAQVVAVLQAVNLLLGTSLFVVVLGVDPTWLERSLRSQYNELVSGSTPREYLEKIIQVPYVLPAMADRFSTLMTSIVGPLAPDGPTAATPAATGGGPPADGSDGPRPGTDAAAAEPSAQAGTTGPADPAGPTVPADTITVEADSAAASGGDAKPVQQPTAPTSRELEMLAAMGPLVRTPRAATRLVNLYRLVRTTRDIGRSSRFLGTDGAPADYLVVVPLLAIATRSPDVLAELNVRLRSDETDQRKVGTWSDLLSQPAPEHLQPEWDEITACLRALASRFDVPSDLAPYRTWAPRLARFTFTLSASSAAANGASTAGSPATGSRLTGSPAAPWIVSSTAGSS